MPLSAVASPRVTLLKHLTNLDLLTGLSLCLDAGDDLSAPSSPTKWLDRTANGYDFFMGTTVGSDATDPTFNGSVGGQTANEYWSFDSGDFFRYDAANETWMQSLHQDNAKFTLVAWVQFGALGAFSSICGTLGAFAGNTGFQCGIDTANIIYCEAVNAGVDVKTLSSTTAVSAANTWVFAAFSVDEAAGAVGGIVQVNGSQNIVSATYTSPAAGNASFTMEIGANGNAVIPLPNTSRMGMFAAWGGTALTAGQLDQIYRATKTRFGV